MLSNTYILAITYNPPLHQPNLAFYTDSKTIASTAHQGLIRPLSRGQDLRSAEQQGPGAPTELAAREEQTPLIAPPVEPRPHEVPHSSPEAAGSQLGAGRVAQAPLGSDFLGPGRSPRLRVAAVPEGLVTPIVPGEPPAR